MAEVISETAALDMLSGNSVQLSQCDSRGNLGKSTIMSFENRIKNALQFPGDITHCQCHGFIRVITRETTTEVNRHQFTGAYQFVTGNTVRHGTTGP